MTQQDRGPSVWSAPIVLALLSSFGLVAALVSDDLGDALAWFALSVPVLVVAWYWLRAPRKAPESAAAEAQSRRSLRRT